MRAHRISVGPHPTRGPFPGRDREGHRVTQRRLRADGGRGRGDAAEARSHRGLPGTAPSKDAPLRREHGPADTAIRGFQPLGL